MSWHPLVVMGDDGTPVQTVQTTQEKPDGYLHIWAKFQLPGGRPMQIHAKIELAPIVAELAAQQGVEVGRFGRRLKRFAKRIARSKLVKGVVKTVKRAINNPLVKAALSATPAGAALYATRAAARVAAKAIKGSRKAKAYISGVASAANQGHPGAVQAMRLIRCGVRAHAPQLASAVSGNERQAFMVIAGWGDPGVINNVGIGCDRWHPQGEGAETEQEIDAVNEFASSGAWEGVRWVASRMGLHSMNARQGELTARGALLDGRAAMARRFA